MCATALLLQTLSKAPLTVLTSIYALLMLRALTNQSAHFVSHNINVQVQACTKAGGGCFTKEQSKGLNCCQKLNRVLWWVLLNFLADCTLSLLSVLVLVIVPRSAWCVAKGYFARPHMSRRKLEQHKEHDTVEQIHVEAVGLIEALCEGLPQLVLQTAVYCLDYSQAKARVPYFLFSIGVSAGMYEHCITLYTALCCCCENTTCVLMRHHLAAIFMHSRYKCATLQCCC
jgi:hypothetical protein